MVLRKNTAQMFQHW